jgi:thioredoxin-like negative regulator of GroEL/predicted DNA-binding protein YlxM (UPF0122 family)
MLSHRLCSFTDSAPEVHQPKLSLDVGIDELEEKAAAVTAAFSIFQEALIFTDRIMKIKVSISAPVLSLFYRSVLIFFLFFCFTSPGQAADIAPDKDIVIVGEESQEPGWKKMWDRGRDLTRNQKFQEAIPYYKEVLKQKPNVEEVKWELCRVLIETKRYDEASLLLESLLETSDTRIEYLLSAGDIALLTGKEKQAVFYFGQALEQDPGGKFYFRSLQGLVDALILQGKEKQAIPLMEQLYQSGGETPDLLLNLAEIFRKFGELHKAGYYYQELISKYRTAPQVLRTAASTFERLDRMETAAALWEKYLAEGEESLYLRQKLSAYYLGGKQYEEALPHLLVLLDHDINREEYLLEVGRIYLTTLGRADKALGYYEQYHDEFPEGSDVTGQIAKVRLILANNLLSIIENDGAWMLWTDLAKITPDRIGIYQAMADLLETLGKYKELQEVLQIIHIHKPGDMDVRLKLSSLYYRGQSYQRCLDTLYEIRDQDNLPVDYFQLRLRCEGALNNDPALLTTYLDYLNHYPDDEDLRLKAIILSGRIGDVAALDKILDGYIRDSIRSSVLDRTIFKAGINAYISNQFLTKADRLISSILQKKNIDTDTYNLFYRKSAKIKYLFNRKFTAEQQLRMTVLRDHLNADIFLDLAEQAINSEELQTAVVWLSGAEKNMAASLTEQRSRLNYYRLLVSRASGKETAMRKGAMTHLESLKAKTEQFNRWDYKIFTMLAAHYYRNQSYQLYQETVSRYSDYVQSGTIVSALQLTSEQPAGQGNERFWKEIIDNSAASELFELFELLVLLDEPGDAQLVLEDIERRIPGSVQLEIARAELYLSKNQGNDAIKVYRHLAEAYPDEEFFSYQASMIAKFGVGGSDVSWPEQEDVTADNQEISSVERRLEEARSTWNADNETAALELYRDLELSLREKIQPLLEQAKQLNDYRSISDESFWDSFLDGEDDTSILDQIMSSSFFAANLDADIALQSAENFETYRWLKIVSKEREAKQALNQREFYQAEKRYQELVEEENVRDVNVYSDLATVYSRLERYAKETELLEKIKEQKVSYPQLKSVFEKNINRRRPQLSFESLFREEDGRNDAINIKQQYLGLGLKIQPTLYQEGGFQAGRSIYGDSSDNSILTSNTLGTHYALFFGDETALHTRFGFEDIKEDTSTYFYYDIKFSGRLAKSVEGFAGMNQELVSDTIQSLSEGIYVRNLQAGITIDYLPSIFLGIDFTALDYSDDNDGKRFHLWSSYRLFSDVSSLDVTYDYVKMENSLDSDQYTPDQSGLSVMGPAYWSPGNYWKHALTAKVKRELWPPGKRQSGDSYVSAKYGVGYEVGDNVIQQFELDILLEISTPFLLKGTFISDWSGDYNRIKAFATFVYRW